MPRAPANSGNSVTHAMLDQKLDQLSKAVADIVIDYTKIDECIRLLQQIVAVHTEQISNQTKRIDSLDTQVKAWGGVNTLGVIIASILGYLGIQK